MHDEFHLFRRCIQECPSVIPACNCTAEEQCVSVARGCDNCPSNNCVPISSSSGSGGGVSKGAIAGGVIGALILLAASILLLLWYRRRQRAQQEIQDKVNVKSDVPAPAEAVLSRPDPVEKPASSFERFEYERGEEAIRNYQHGEVIYHNASLPRRRQSAHGSEHSNPFTDSQSIQTASGSSQSTNVIPIALVPHGSVTSPQRSQSPISDRGHASLLSASSSGSNGTTSSAPARPAVSPDIGIRFDPLSSNLNLEHVNVSKESFRPPNVPYAHSQASGFSNRSSVMTSGSFASDVLYEAPQIVTPASGAVRQVLHVAKAEVVSVSGSSPATPTTANTLNSSASTRGGRPPARSPLAQSSFGPNDVLAESQELEIHSPNPFGDEHSPMHGPITGDSYGMLTPVPLPSTASPTRGTYIYPHSPPPIPPESASSERERPVSTFTQAASIIDAEIQGATLVRLASASSTSTSTSSSSRSLNRMTSARLVSPSSAPLRVEDDRAMQDQQAQAIATARANGRMVVRRMSDATSVASAGGDSLLESFTFVPPSPISSRPPRSPLAAQQAGGSGLGSRQIQGMSNASALSTGSALEGYTFHIAGPARDSELPAPSVPRNTDSLQIGPTDSMQIPPSKAPVLSNGIGRGNNNGGPRTLQGRQRASLDTLALTADLSAFPLNFDDGR